jgi:hypothetical protein
MTALALLIGDAQAEGLTESAQHWYRTAARAWLLRGRS